MMGLKPLSIFVAFLIIGGAFWWPVRASAGRIILVSDNPADYAAARAVSSATGAEIITSPWGRFDDSVVQKVLSLAPGEVIIIGGPVAVPGDYAENLNARGIKVTRIAGEDRAETSETVLNWIIDGGYRVKGDLYLLDGWDEGSILYVLQSDENAIVFALPHHDLVNAIHEKSGLTNKMASATGYGRSVYVYPTLVDASNGSLPCSNCSVMEADELKALSLSVSRLKALSRGIGDDATRALVIGKVESAESLASQGELEKARKILIEGFGIAYSAMATKKPGPADTSSGSSG
ncbi:cell wall-binding repeat-containing protein [Thermococcus sp. ES12]|uniref:cell wall-binding repeat-containing protein n=1 Tax=Thermococcus sp. ES12 TaxID=1638246 RepID=UPI0014311C0B|nr:hypothetical protein [Thermococcus sp. ES12]NJE76044.1 hypothetical protein [Thermococcus sp. ES12]